MNFSRTVFKNSMYGFIAQLAIKIISFTFTVLVIRRLGVGTYGQYTAVLAFGTVFAIFSDLGLGAYATREVARLRKQEGGIPKIGVLFSNILILRLCLTVFTGIAVILAAFISRRPGVMIGAIAINCLSLFMYSIQGASEAVIAGHEKLGYVAFTKITYQFIFVILGALVLWLGIGYYGLIFANLTALVLFTYLNWKLVTGLGFHVGKPDPKIWFALLRTSIPFGLIGFALGLSYKFDSVLLNITRSDVETGYYNAAYNLIFSVVIISNVINTALYPSIVAHTSLEADRLISIFQRAWRYLLIISLPIATGGWILTNEIIKFLYGSEYSSSARAFSILIWVIPLMFSSEFLGYVVVIRNQEARVARAVIVSTVINVLLNIIFVPRFGFIAAAYMTVLTEAILVVQDLYSLRDLIRQTSLRRILVGPILSALSMGIIVFLSKSHFHLFVSILVGVLSFIAASVLFKVLGKDDVNFARSLLVSRKATL